MSAAEPGRYQRLEVDGLRATLDRLVARITARFPERNLVLVAGEVGHVIDDIAHDAATVGRTRELLRRLFTGLALAIAAIAVVAIVLSVRDAFHRDEGRPAFEWLPVLESGINDIAFAGIAVFFLLRVPERLQRRSTLKLLYRLRSLAHVVDMHQLAKDPDMILSEISLTEASRREDLTLAELGRYLDYCSELLALVSKAAALCAQDSDDGVVLDTVSEIETLCSGLRSGIWQKIDLLH